MKRFDEIVKNVNEKSLYSYNEPFVNKNEKFSEADYEIINKLFATLKSIFPAFRQAWPTDEEYENAKYQWTKAFEQAGLNNLQDIKRGIDKYRLLTSPFVPSPGQFIEMCKKEISLVPPMYPYLPQGKATPEVVNENMLKIREMLGIRKITS